jgi:Flp pilus assembly protein TadD
LSGDVVRNTEQARQDTERAYKLIQSGKYTDAEAALNRAITADPMYGPAHNDLGLVYYQQERLYDAAWQFQDAMKLMPGHPQPANNLGLVLERSGKTEEAMRSFEQAVEAEPENVEYAGNLARCRLRLNLRDGQTRRLLELVAMKDHRTDWVDWARFNLTRMGNSSAAADEGLSATRSTNP